MAFTPTQIVLIVALAATLAAVALFKAMWRVAEPNEALIISGFNHRNSDDPKQRSLGFRVVTGKGTLVLPGLEAVRRMSLDLREADLQIDCVTHQGIPLRIRGVVIYKVGDDTASIANAARRFLDQQKDMSQRVHNVFSGHLRAIVGNMTVEEMIRDREKLTQLTREASGVEMQKLGLIVDSLQIQEIGDPTGYIDNLGRPHAAAVESQARIAQAGADEAATEREQEADAHKAEARRSSQVLQARYAAEINQANARAKQVGPLAEAKAVQEVVVEQTHVAELEAEREEQRLQASVRKPADAQAYEVTTLARAERDSRISSAEATAKETELASSANAARTRVEAEAAATQIRLESAATAESTKAIAEADATAARLAGEADAVATQAKGLAEAEAIRARAEAMSKNKDAILSKELVRQWPAIVEAAAKPFGDIEHMVVLNGAQGLSDALAQVVSQGVTGIKFARDLLSTAEASAEEPTASAGSNGDRATATAHSAA